MPRVCHVPPSSQLLLPTISSANRRTTLEALFAYAIRHKRQYQHWAAFITPLTDIERGWRVVFSMISAHERFENAVTAYACIRQLYAVHDPRSHRQQLCVCRQALSPHIMRGETKGEWAAAILDATRVIPRLWTKNPEETWDQYAGRIRCWPGLHTVKSHFAAGLCYPLESENACLDTHIMALLFKKRGRTPNQCEYKRALWWFRAFAKRVRCNAFLAQWMAWDWARGEMNDHGFLKGETSWKSRA